MIKISSTSKVSGFLYEDEEVFSLIEKEAKQLDGFKKVKLYLDKSNSSLVPTLNIVIMLKKEYEIMNKLDNSLDRVEAILEWEFKYRIERINIYVIWK
jgi:hypothetical protein